MRYVEMAGGRLRVSALCLGCGPVGSGLDGRESFALLDSFVEAGGTFVDTALVYANWLPGERSVSEKTIGRWLRDRGLRGRVVVATKGAHPPLDRLDQARLGRADIAADLEESLRNLRTDCIDLYWLHRDDPGRPVGEILETLEESARAGSIRHYGCSNWRPARMREAHAYAREHGMAGFVANQPMWSFARPDVLRLTDRTMVAMDGEGERFHRETGTAVVPYSSQARGFLTKWERGPETVNAKLRDLYGSAENLARLERARRVADELGTSVGTVALLYLMSSPFPAVPIIGAKNPQQLRDGLAAADLSLSPAQRAYLDGGAGW